MAATGVAWNLAKKQMTDKGLSYYTVKMGPDPIDQQTEDIPVSEAVAQLEETLMQLQGVYCTVEAQSYPPGEGQRGASNQHGKRERFTYKVILSTVQGNALAGGQGFTNSNMWEKLFEMKAEHLQYVQQQQIKALKDQIDQMKNDRDSMFMTLLDKQLSRIVGGGIPPSNQPLKQPDPVAGDGKGATVKESLSRIKSIDPNYIQSLEMFSIYAQANPNLYKGLIEQIAQQFQQPQQEQQQPQNGTATNDK